VTQFTSNAGSITLQWQSVVGRTYRVQQSDDLATWSQLTALTATATTSSFSISTNGGPRRFFRVVTP
jgi:hypothetical protein